MVTLSQQIAEQEGLAYKGSLNRWLSAVRGDIGRYLWVLEFQKRGAPHIHIFCEKRPAAKRIAELWAAAIGEGGHIPTIRHGCKISPAIIKSRDDSDRGVGGDFENIGLFARKYALKYLGKSYQKELPEGVEGFGRWWGSSRGLVGDGREIENIQWILKWINEKYKNGWLRGREFETGVCFLGEHELIEVKAGLDNAKI